MGLYYRETIVWRKAMDMVKLVYKILPYLPKEEVYGIRSQLSRSAVSVPANIAEGWARETANERAYFLSIAQGSLAETETYIILCEELRWLQTEDIKDVQALIVEINKILATLRRKHREQS